MGLAPYVRLFKWINSTFETDPGQVYTPSTGKQETR